MCARKPKLRFKGFTDDWEQRKLGDMVSFSKGTGYSKSDLQDEGTPIILYGRLYTKYETVISNVDTFAEEKPNSVLSKGREVIVPASGETAEDISVASVVEKEGILLGGDLNIITPPADLDSAFLALSISNGNPHNDMAKMAQGKSVVHLHNSDLAKIDLPYPSYKEQCKISSHFAHIDNLITLHQRKLEKIKNIKKSMLEKMFPHSGQKTPEFRFAGFTDDWEQRKLGEIVERITRKNTGMESTLPLTISAQYGLIDQNEFFDKRIASKDVSGYYLVYNGEFAYNKSTSSDAPWGAIKRLDRYEKGVLSTLYIVFTIKDNEKTDSDYLSTYYDSSLWHKEVQAIAAEGARNHGLLNISPSDFFETKLSIPNNIDEQRKIGAYFSNLYNLITLH
uniref:restriction endonuclease subunit S n=1 Tax=Anaerovibrio sp. TaxID=1872532 RepID=UPI003890E966